MRRRLLGVTSVPLAVAVLLIGGERALGASVSGPPASLLVQVSTLSSFTPATVDGWLASICVDRRPKTIALQDVATPDGALATPYLDVIVKYLPGGSRPCFNRAFIGTVDLTWTGTGSMYSDGVQDNEFRGRYLSLSQSVARAFRSRYPQVRAGWYLSYEANLNELFYPAVQNAYKTLLSSEIQLLNAIRPGQVMWSPAFWYPYSAYSQNAVGMSQLRTMLTDLFTTVKVQFLDLQDYVGGSACQPAWNRVTASDAASWAGFLGSLGRLSGIEVNSELYAPDCLRGGIGPGDAQEIASRRAFYASRGLTLGPAFELRYWIQTRPTV